MLIMGYSPYHKVMEEIYCNTFYREGAGHGDGSSAYMMMLEQVEGGVGHDPVSIAGGHPARDKVRAIH